MTKPPDRTPVAAGDTLSGALRAVLTGYRGRRAALYAVHPRGRHLAPKVRVFVDLLREAFGEADWAIG